MSTDTLRRSSIRSSRLAASSKWIFVGIGLVVALVPFIWMLATSFRTERDLFSNPASLIPTEWTLHGYQGVWEQLPSCYSCSTRWSSQGLRRC